LMNPSSDLTAYPSRAAKQSLARSLDVSNDDAALIRRMAEGDETALAQLYDHWVSLVYSMIIQLLRDADEAEDVVEETFWQAWQRAPGYDPARGTVRSWLFTIARSRTLDRMRARARRREEVNLTDVTVAAADADPQLHAEGRERRARVLAALAEIPDDQGQTLELAYFHGLSQTEIAELLSQPLGTIKTRMRLGMQKLREKLGLFHDEYAGEGA
jgi:RNA polymerase sigma-70 factor (ECF subfamily)